MKSSGNLGSSILFRPIVTRHWFQVGDDGAVVSEYSSASHDEGDISTDPHVVRETNITDGQ